MSLTNDDLFRRERLQAKDFDFGEDTARVFDNMLDRSVPFYTEIQRMIGEMAADFAVPGTNLYDLGCSTGNTFLQIDSVVAKGVNFIGTDASEAMLAKAKVKLASGAITHPCELICSDLNNGGSIENASVVIMNLVLQFVRPLRRTRVWA